MGGWIRPPERFLDEIVAKGSVAVDGVSLTVAEVLADRFSVALVPLTLAATTLSGLPWAGELAGPAGVGKCVSHLAAGGGVMIYDPEREAEADVVFAGTRLRPESMAFLLTQVCGHTTVPCDRDRGASRSGRCRVPATGTAPPTTPRSTSPPAGNRRAGARPGRDHPPPGPSRRHARRFPAARSRLPFSWAPRRPGRAGRSYRGIAGGSPVTEI